MEVDRDLRLLRPSPDELGGGLAPAQGLGLSGESEADRVDDGRLAGAVGADDHVEVGPRLEGHRHVLHEVGQGHAGDGPRHHRPGHGHHLEEFVEFSLLLEYFTDFSSVMTVNMLGHICYVLRLFVLERIRFGLAPQFAAFLSMHIRMPNVS